METTDIYAEQEQQMDTALNKIMSELVAWGLSDSEEHYKLGYRQPTVMRLSLGGAIMVYDLLNTLTGEIDRLEKIIQNLDEVYGKSLAQAIFDKKAGN
jgi:hypothetical protein